MILPTRLYEKLASHFDDLFEKCFPNVLMTEKERLSFRDAWEAYLEAENASDDDFLETMENRMSTKYPPAERPVK